MILITTRRIRQIVEQTVTGLGKDMGESISVNLKKLKDVGKLSLELEELKIEKLRREEEYEKRERELEHKVGLERKRQEFEIEQAKREAKVEIKEGNLAEKEKTFEERMAFMTERFEKEVDQYHTQLSSMMEKIPTAEIFAHLGAIPESKQNKLKVEVD